MSTISTTEQTAPTGTYVNSDAPADIRYGCALKETSMVGNAMVTMADMMLMFSQLANDKFTQMSKKMDVARDVQDMANRLEIIMSKLEKDSDVGEMPADIIKYMKENNILIGDKPVDEFLADNGGKWTKKNLESVKVALESAGGKASDFVQQSQLKLQQLMQNFNTAVTMANSIQSMNAESTKSIAQSIR
jgi:secreted effector protein SseB